MLKVQILSVNSVMKLSIQVLESLEFIVDAWKKGAMFVFFEKVVLVQNLISCNTKNDFLRLILRERKVGMTFLKNNSQL